MIVFLSNSKSKDKLENEREKERSRVNSQFREQTKQPSGCLVKCFVETYFFMK